jgi:hypothetical protein
MATMDGKQLKNSSVTAAKVASDVLVTDAARTLLATLAVGTGGDITTRDVPTGATSVVNKTYVDALAGGLLVKASVKAATAAALPANTRSGNVLTADADGVLPDIDTSVTLVAGDRLLVKNEALGQNNGIYVVTSVGTVDDPWVLTRAADADNTPAGEVAAGMYCFATGGTANGLKGWSLVTPDPITLNTTALTFSQYLQASDIAVGTFDSGTKSANGLHIDGHNIIAQSADATHPGMMTTGSQTFAGDKAFNGSISSGTTISATGTISGSNISSTGTVAAGSANSGTNTGDVTIGNLGTGTDAKGATISNQVISMQAASAGGPGLLSASDFSKLAAISGSNTGDQSLRSDMRGLTASATTSDYDQAMSTTVSANNTHGGEVAVFVNGQKQFVGDGTRSADCYFGASSAAARAFSAIVATDKLYWVGSVSGFQLAATDKIDVMFLP